MTDTVTIEALRKDPQTKKWVEVLNEFKGVSVDIYDDPTDNETIILGEVAGTLEALRSNTGYINNEYGYFSVGFDVNDRASFNNFKGTWIEVLFEIKKHVFAKIILPDNPERPSF